jgi:hypothetical protein
MEIRNIDGFSGLFASQHYKANEIIHTLSGEVLKYPTRTSIEINTNTHIEDKYGQMMNHSFEPSCCIQDGCIVTLNDIVSGEELTFNYNENETKMKCPFVDRETNTVVSGKYSD